MGPSFSIVPSKSDDSGVERNAGLLADGTQELDDGVGEHERKSVATESGNRFGEGGDGVLIVDHRAVPGLAPGGQPHPSDGLLGRLDQVQAALTAVGARHGQRKPADFTDRLGDAVEEIGPIVHQPVRPVLAAVLLVGDEREDEIARRHDARTLQLSGDHDHHADHVLHVDRAAAPDIAVFDRSGKRVHAPVGRFGRHHVEMPMDEQGATRTVGARETGEHIAPAWRTGFEVFGLIADLGQLLGDPPRALRLTLGGLGFAGVGGIESDQPADNLDHVIARLIASLEGHSHPSYHCWARGAFHGQGKPGAGGGTWD